MSNPPGTEFERAGGDQAGESFLGEMIGFLKHNKKWWLLPIFVILALFAVLMLMSGSAIAPFIYTLF